MANPDLVVFNCESCEAQVNIDRTTGKNILPWKKKLGIEPAGTCRKCGGDSWTISVIYAQVGVDTGPTALGLGAMAVTGVGFTQSSTAVNQTDYANIGTSIVSTLIEDPLTILSQVSVFAKAMAREDLVDHGAIECSACGALFVPIAEKSWTGKGFCSKVCAFQTEGASAIKKTSVAKAGKPKANMMTVKCDDGHDFEVAISFRGLRRPCPTCGLKTAVPEN